jgi:hypothetical protein
MSKLSKLWVELSEGNSNGNIMKYITEILGIPVESEPNRLGSLSYLIALLLRDEENRLSTERILQEFDDENNQRRRESRLNMLTANGLTSRNERNFGRSARESDWKSGMSDPAGATE